MALSADFGLLSDEATSGKASSRFVSKSQSLPSQWVDQKLLRRTAGATSVPAVEAPVLGTQSVSTAPSDRPSVDHCTARSRADLQSTRMELGSRLLSRVKYWLLITPAKPTQLVGNASQNPTSLGNRSRVVSGQDCSGPGFIPFVSSQLLSPKRRMRQCLEAQPTGSPNFAGPEHCPP